VVELVDLYPTVAEWCGLRGPATLAGRSLVPLLRAPDTSWTGTAFTQILRPGEGTPVMGRSVRTDRWRYTEWGGGEAGVELYDHATDPKEFTNLGADPAHAATRTELRRLFEGKVGAAVPTTPFDPRKL
jgi:uncharacterized sulfatase